MTEEDAKEIVRAAKFPPKGERGSSSICRSARWTTEKALTYRDYANEETLVAIMIEDYRAIGNLEKIFAVDGIDVAVFGPSDFSASVGAFGEGLKNPKVMDALKQTLSAAHKHGKHVCVGVSYPWVEQAKNLAALGADMIEIGHDISILARMYQDLVPEIRKIPHS
jgi:4-hydroxy-2-oxoheptanedioate aldolase